MYVEGSMDCIAQQFSYRTTGDRILKVEWDQLSTLNDEWAYIPRLADAIVAARLDSHTIDGVPVLDDVYRYDGRKEVVFYLDDTKYLFIALLDSMMDYTTSLINCNVMAEVVF